MRGLITSTPKCRPSLKMAEFGLQGHKHSWFKQLSPSLDINYPLQDDRLWEEVQEKPSDCRGSGAKYHLNRICCSCLHFYIFHFLSIHSKAVNMVKFQCEQKWMNRNVYAQLWPFANAVATESSNGVDPQIPERDWRLEINGDCKMFVAFGKYFSGITSQMHEPQDRQFPDLMREIGWCREIALAPKHVIYFHLFCQSRGLKKLF